MKNLFQFPSRLALAALLIVIPGSAALNGCSSGGNGQPTSKVSSPATPLEAKVAQINNDPNLSKDQKDAAISAIDPEYAAELAKDKNKKGS